MAALLAVLSEAPKTVSELLEAILDHERRFWRRELPREGLLGEIDIEEVDAVVAGLVLCNGARDRKGGRETVGRLLELSPKTPSVKKLVTKLHRLYEGGEGAYIEPLQPDLLGEALVDVALERDPELLDRVLEEADDAIRERLLTVLTRLAQQEATASGEPGDRWLKRALAGHLETLAEPALQVVLETGEPAGEALAQVIRDHGSDEVARRLLKSFQREGEWVPIAHRDVAAAASQRALKLLPRGKKYARERAWLLGTLGVDLAALGHPEQALELTQETVEIHRELSHKEPGAMPKLAGSLERLGVFLSSLGHHQQALEATQEATSRYRKLVQQRPDDYLPDLAMSLNNLGIRFSNLGRPDQALEATQEAVDLYKRLVEHQAGTFRPNLARGLSNLGVDLSTLGRREQALEATQQAVDIYRKLANQRPEAFLPNLATSLNNLGLRLAEFGRREQALAVAEEAVGTLLPFLRALPAAFSRQMTSHFRNYQKHAEEAGREPDAELVREVGEILASLETSD